MEMRELRARRHRGIQLKDTRMSYVPIKPQTCGVIQQLWRRVTVVE